MCFEGRPLSRKRSQDMTTATATDAKLTSSADTLYNRHPSKFTVENSNHEDLALRSRTLRSRLRHTGESSSCRDKGIDGRSIRVLPRLSVVLDRDVGQQSSANNSTTAKTCRDRKMVESQHSVVTQNTTEDTDGEVLQPNASGGGKAEHSSHEISHQRTLGMTRRTSMPFTEVKVHDLSRTTGSGSQSAPGLGNIGSNTKDEVSASSDTESMPGLDSSFTKLVSGLRQIFPRWRVSGESATTQAEMLGITQSHCLHQNSEPLKRSLGRRRQRLDSESSYSEVDEEQWKEGKESCDLVVQVQDCMVVLERSRSIENMVKGFEMACSVAETKTMSHSLSLASPISLSPSRDSLQAESTSLSSSAAAAEASSVVRNLDRRHKLSLHKSPRDEVLSFSPPRKNSSSQVLESIPSEKILHVDLPLTRDLNSAAQRNVHSSETSESSKVGNGKDDRCSVSLLPLLELSKLSGNISEAVRHRLKRRKVCLQLTGSGDMDTGFDTEVVMDGCNGTSASNDLASSGTDAEQNRVTLLQPAPDLLPSPSTMKRTKMSDEDLCRSEIIPQPDPDLLSLAVDVISRPDPDFVPSIMKHAKTTKANLDRSEVIPQPDLDSCHLIETTDDRNVGNRTFAGQAKFTVQSDPNLSYSQSDMADHKSEAVLRPDPDPTPVIYVGSVDASVLSQSEVMILSDPVHRQPDPHCLHFIGQTDFTADCSMDAMYRMALFSDPETSDPDSSPPVPSSPSETFPGGNQTSTGQQMAFYDDDDDVEKEQEQEEEREEREAVDYTSDTKHQLLKEIKPQVNFFPELKQDSLHQTSDYFTNDVLSSTFAKKIIPTSDSELAADEDYVQEPQLVVGESEEKLRCNAEESLSHLAGDLNSGNNDVDLTASCNISVRKMDYNDENLSHPEEKLNFDVNGHEKMDIAETLSVKESVTVSDYVVEDGLTKLENMRSDFISCNSDRRKNSDNVSLMSRETLFGEELTNAVEVGDTTTSVFSGDGMFNSAGKSELAGRRKDNIGSTANEENCSSVLVDSLVADDLVIMCPETLPPSRHQVMFDVASSCRSMLLQSAYDAFCSDVADLPPRPWYIMMLRISA